MNQEKHWDTIGNKYVDEIFDVFKSDKNGVLTKYFIKHGNKKHTAIDFGCGIGKAFQFLSPVFKEVIGTDISAELLAQAENQPYENIRLIKADLVNPKKRFPLVDFAFCCNVIMLPELESNYAMFRTIRKSLKSTGHALIIIPSIESLLFASWRLLDWYQKEGVAPEDVDNAEFDYFTKSKRDIVLGKVQIDGVPTKHYSKEELQVITRNAGLQITAIEKIEYDWSTEFNKVPKWMKDPYPWDWMIDCKPLGKSS